MEQRWQPDRGEMGSEISYRGVYAGQRWGQWHGEEYRNQVVLEVLSGAKTPLEACWQYGIAPGILALWKAHFLIRVRSHLAAEMLAARNEGRIRELTLMNGWLLHYGNSRLVFYE